MASTKNFTGYELSRQWFDWSYENPEKINSNHTALYFFIIDHYNRLGHKENFGLPSYMAMEALGIKNYRTFKKAFQDLIDWQFISLIEKSKNQYSTNIIAIVFNTKAHTKARTKARLKHLQKQRKSTATINKPFNPITQEPLNIYRAFAHLSISLLEFDKLISEGFTQSEIDEVLDSIQNYKKNNKYTSLLITCRKWLKKNQLDKNGKPKTIPGSNITREALERVANLPTDFSNENG